MSPRSTPTPPPNGPPPKPPAAVNTGVAVAVVGGALVSVTEHLVGFAGLFELFFGRVVAGIAVRMILERLLAVCALQFLVAAIVGNSQHLVIVGFAHVNF